MIFNNPARLIVFLMAALLVTIGFCLFFPPPQEEALLIYVHLRIPRVLMALATGTALSLSGLMIQTIVRNPLAEPYTLGLSGGASLFIGLAILLNASTISLPLWGFLGSLLTVWIILSFALKRYQATSLVLIGVVISYITSSLLMLIFSISSSHQTQQILYWLMGDLSRTALPQAILLLSLSTLALFYLLIRSRQLDLLSLGEERAQQLGLDAHRLRLTLLVFVSILVSLSVSYCGIIGFVGLLIPHTIRLLIPFEHRFMLSASFLWGGIFLMLSDWLARMAIHPLELPVGVITGIIGGIFFLIILTRQKNRGIS